MKILLLIIVLLPLGLAALLAALAWWGAHRFNRQSGAGADHLLSQARPVRWDRSTLDSLPEPVRRYLAQALPEPGTEPCLAKARLRGEMRLNPADRWQPWQGWQAWSMDPPAFLWSARMVPSPILPVHARDALLDGRGGLLVKAWGWLTMARATSVPELDQGSLQRWLAEAPLLPPALLPGPHLRWEAIDESSARAVVTAGDTEAEGVFSFSRRGLPLSFYTPARWQQQPDGSFMAAPWQGRFGRWRRREGCLVPTWAQASWLPSTGGEFAYIRAEVEQWELC